MNALLAFFLLLHGAYALFVWKLGSALDGTQRLPAPSQGEEDVSSSDEGVTVVIPARNEVAALPGTLRALATQSLPKERWEVLVVDDGSTDATAEVAQAHLAELSTWGMSGRLLHTKPDARGKKAAIVAGRQAARHAWVAVLDADSQPSPRWLECMLAQAGPHDGLLAGPVVFSGGDDLWARLVRLEYMGLLGAGLASFGLGRPLFASGANLWWRGRAFDEAGGYTGLGHIASADDTLLIQRMRLRTAWRQSAVLDPRALVGSRAPATLGAFVRQRVRWTSTERHMPDPLALAASVGLYLVFTGCVLAPLLAMAGLWPVWPALFLPLLKLLADARLTARAAGVLEGTALLPLFPWVWLGQLAYGLTLPWVGLTTQVRWRGEAKA